MAETNAWVNSGLAKNSVSERSVAGWDEDVITMAVEASRDALTGFARHAFTGIYLGSTTAPFSDRLNSGVVAGALALNDRVAAQDTTGSQRAGTTALLAGLNAVAANGGYSICVASERRMSPAGSAQELTAGHGAAAVLVGPGSGVARLVAHASLTVDFVGSFRSSDREFDYEWEERWVREQGFGELVPRLVNRLLNEADIKPSTLTAFCLPCPLPRLDRAVAVRLGIPDASVRDNISDGCGNTGAAHSMVMLVDALEQASAGDRILVVGFGQGGDALLFEVTDAIREYRQRATGLRKWLRRRTRCSYSRYLGLHGLIKMDRSIRSEVDKGTALSAEYRHHDLTLSLTGGRCDECGTYQIPRTRVCVKPECWAVDSQKPHSFAESAGHVVTWSCDRLTYSPDPPAYYGMIDFVGGGRLMMDFTDVGASGIEIGNPVRMVFRVKDIDHVRGYRRYFWKATPAATE